MANHIFLTGATGFLGRNILKLSLENNKNSKISLLIRANTISDAKVRMDKIIDSIYPDRKTNEFIDRINILKGDVSLENFGLTSELYTRLAKDITHIIHSAAAVSFNLSLEDARKTNLNGTKNILKLGIVSKKKGNLKKISHISTAYVCGNRNGEILEGDLESDQKFANSYEQSKFESEQIVKKYMEELPITVFRPSIIVGDSNTGRTSSFNVMYLPLNMIFKGKLKVLVGDKNVPLDIVPVNYVSEAIYYLTMNCSNTKSKTFHITAGRGNTMSACDLIEGSMRYFKNVGIISVVPKIKFISLNTVEKLKRKFKGKVNKSLVLADLYKNYLCTKREFNNSGTLLALIGTDIRVRPLHEYIEKLLKFSLECNWGKKLADSN